MTKLLSRGLVERAMRDVRFKNMFPEFNGIERKPVNKPGCRNCRKTVATVVQLATFLRIAESLGAAKLATFKKYFNADVLQYRLNNEVRIL